MPTNPRATGGPYAAMSEEAARAKDREVLEVLRLIDAAISRQNLKRVTQLLIPIAAAVAATFVLLIVWVVAHAIIFGVEHPEGSAALILGLGSCVILLAVPFATYFVMRALLVQITGKALGARDGSVRTLLNLLESKFPEYARAIGGKEAALDTNRRNGHEHYYLFTIPGMREKQTVAQAQPTAKDGARTRKKDPQTCNHTWGPWHLKSKGVGWRTPGVDARTCEQCGKSEEKECEHEWGVRVHDETYGDYHRCKHCDMLLTWTDD